MLLIGGCKTLTVFKDRHALAYTHDTSKSQDLILAVTHLLSFVLFPSINLKLSSMSFFRFKIYGWKGVIWHQGLIRICNNFGHHELRKEVPSSLTLLHLPLNFRSAKTRRGAESGKLQKSRTWPVKGRKWPLAWLTKREQRVRGNLQADFALSKLQNLFRGNTEEHQLNALRTILNLVTKCKTFWGELWQSRKNFLVRVFTFRR